MGNIVRNVSGDEGMEEIGGVNNGCAECRRDFWLKEIE